MLVATVTTSLAAKVPLCTVVVYNHHLGRRYNCSIKPIPGLPNVCVAPQEPDDNSEHKIPKLSPAISL